MGILLTVMARDAATGEEFEAFHWTRSAQSGVDRAHSDAKRHGRAISHAWIGRTLLARYALQTQSGAYLGQAFTSYSEAFNYRAQHAPGARVVEL